MVAENCPVKVKIMGIPDEPAIAGTTPEVFEHYGISAEAIHQMLRNELKGNKEA